MDLSNDYLNIQQNSVTLGGPKVATSMHSPAKPHSYEFLKQQMRKLKKEINVEKLQ